MKNDLSCYDPYDIWKTSMGISVKKLFYRNKYLGIIPAGLLSFFDLYLNNTNRLFYIKQEYPITRAQASLALINLYIKTNEKNYLTHARHHIDWLLENTSKGFNGLSWGTGFKIVISSNLVYDENTPFSTNTPYALEALDKYYQITQESDILNAIKSIYEFYEKEILIIHEDNEVLITSYGPFKDRIVTNAVSYTMYAYSIFYRYMEDSIYIKNKVLKMYSFLKNVQNKNGSWLYAPDNKSFIDCFHSCFVLKNIIKTNDIIKLKNSDKVIKEGYIFVKRSFFDKKSGLYKRFVIKNKPSLVKFDLYDNSEMLNVAKLLGDSEVAERLSVSIDKSFFKNKNLYSIVDIFGNLKNKNTLRWAVMPYILANSQPCIK
ncbi:MAG: hypothetical protein JKX82_00100 [Oleispira sp.]|nr:hypothetical protein [Oleispira sp.]